MMGDRHRSRSRSRGKDVHAAAKSGSSEQEIVSVAIRQLPPEIRERLEKLFDEGLLKEGDLDLRSITVFASLTESLQARVMNHMEGERIYVANARSKSGFLIATCDKAKTGCLDARGLGAIDPWRSALVAMATPKQRQVNLKPEREWLEEKGEDSVIKIEVKLGSSVEAELGVPSVTVELPLTEHASAIKAKLVAMGVKAIPQNKMMLHEDTVGFLKDRHSFAFYNLEDGVTCTLSERKRAGARTRADHTVMPKRPKGQVGQGTASPTQTPAAGAAAAPGGGASAPAPGGANPLDALKNMVGAKMPGMPGLPGMPALPGMTMPGMPKMPGMPGLPGGMPGMPGMAGGMTMPKMPGMSGPGGGFPGMAPPKFGGLPMPFSMPGGGMGMSGPGSMGGSAKAPGMPNMPPMPGMGGMMGGKGMQMGGCGGGMMPPPKAWGGGKGP